jgi:GrpB-like predicted nucleotidyltransferase (UPF0157 family)
MLKPNPVHVLPYDPEWATEFEKIRNALGEKGIPGREAASEC